jgi:hypothetical protein
MPRMIARLALAFLAVLVLAWLGVMLRDARLLRPASFVVIESPPPSRQRFLEAMRHLRESELLNPDTTPKLDRARFLSLRGRPREALVLANQVVDDEPENLEGWGVIYTAARGIDARREAQARTRILELNPLALRRRG